MSSSNNPFRRHDPPAPIGIRRRHRRRRTGRAGLIYITQTFEDMQNKLLELAKPLFKFVTTIDFGSVTYEPEFLATLTKAKMQVKECVVMERRSSRSFRLYVVAPQPQPKSKK